MPYVNCDICNAGLYDGMHDMIWSNPEIDYDLCEPCKQALPDLVTEKNLTHMALIDRTHGMPNPAPGSGPPPPPPLYHGVPAGDGFADPFMPFPMGMSPFGRWQPAPKNMKAYKCWMSDGTVVVEVIEATDGDAFREIMRKASRMETTDMPADWKPPKPTTPMDSEKTFLDIATGAVKHKEMPGRKPIKKETVKIIGASEHAGSFAKFIGVDGDDFILKMHPSNDIKIKHRSECMSVLVDEQPVQ